MKNGSVSLRIATDGDRTVVEALLSTYSHISVPGTGSSSREPGDKSDPAIGEALAVARALRSVASHLEKEANGKMKHREDCKEHKKEIAERRKPVKYGYSLLPDGPEDIKIGSDLL